MNNLEFSGFVGVQKSKLGIGYFELGHMIEVLSNKSVILKLENTMNGS